MGPAPFLSGSLGLLTLPTSQDDLGACWKCPVPRCPGKGTHPEHTFGKCCSVGLQLFGMLGSQTQQHIRITRGLGKNTHVSFQSLSCYFGDRQGDHDGKHLLGSPALDEEGHLAKPLEGFFHVMQLPSRYTLDGPQYLPLRTAKRSCSWENRAVTQSRTWA